MEQEILFEEITACCYWENLLTREQLEELDADYWVNILKSDYE